MRHPFMAMPYSTFAPMQYAIPAIPRLVRAI
jgi:hypothetical protein